MGQILNCKVGHYKTQRKTQAEYSDINHSNNFFSPSRRVREIKTKMDKWEIKGFCTTKETINKTKRQPTEWEKIFASTVTKKG